MLDKILQFLARFDIVQCRGCGKWQHRHVEGDIFFPDATTCEDCWRKHAADCPFCAED